MKKGLSLILAGILALSLVACSQPAAPATTPEQEAPTAVQPAAPEGESWDKEVNILIVGAGGAGLAAAIEAADNGATDILLIEKLAMIGGTTFMSQGQLAGYGTKFAEKEGVDVTFEQVFDQIQKNSGYITDPALMEITVRKTKDTIDWLDEELNIPFDYIRVGYGTLQMMHMIDCDRLAVNALKEPLQNAIDERGVELMLDTKALELLTDETGAVIGAVAEQGGSQLRIKAKAVIMCTGGFGSNAELVETLYPFYRDMAPSGHAATTGEGVIMASKVGAGIVNGHVMMCSPVDYENFFELGAPNSQAAITAFAGQDNSIFVNSRGERFMNERDLGYMAQKLPPAMQYQMFDTGTPYVWAINDKAVMDEYGIKRGMEQPFIEADTPEELAAKMGVDVETLTNTINNYNKYCKDGVDPEFHRAAEKLLPFEGTMYAVKMVEESGLSYGGILHDETARALYLDKEPVPGLYAAGECMGNSCYIGFTLSHAFTWGRIAGSSAAAYVQ